MGAENHTRLTPGEEEVAAALRDVPGLDARGRTTRYRGRQLLFKKIRKGLLGSAGGVEAENVQK